MKPHPLIAALLGRHFWAIAFTMVGLGFLLPGDFRALRPLIPVFLGGILFFTSLRISPAEVRDAIRPATLGRLALLVPWRLIGAPLACWASTRALDAPWAAGLLLLGASPTGMSSVAFSDLFGGSRMFALLQTLATSLLCPFTLPLLLMWLGPHADPGAQAHAGRELAERMAYVAAIIGVPWAAAQAIRAAAPRVVASHDGWWNPMAVLSSCLLTFIAISSNRAAWHGWSAHTMLEPLLLSCQLSVLGFAVGQASRLVLRDQESIAFTCGELWVNNGIAVAVASQCFRDDPYMILPAVLLQLPIIASMSAYGWYLQRRVPVAPSPR